MAKAKAASNQQVVAAEEAQPNAIEDLTVGVAKDIFVKTYMDSSSRTPEHLANKAFEAAEAFAAVAAERTK